MKLSIDKRVFSLDEKNEIIRVRENVNGLLTNETIQDCARYVMSPDTISLVSIEGAEICKNHYTPTVWIRAIMKGYDKQGEFFAELGFDFLEALRNDERAKDAYIRKYRHSRD